MAKFDSTLVYLGVDWGTRRIGLALADSEARVAVPLTTVANVSELLKVIQSEEIAMIIVGSPFKMASTALPLSAEFEKFISELKSRTKVPILFYDERLSSLAADALPGNKKNKAERDEIAAMIILQDYLDSNANQLA